MNALATLLVAAALQAGPASDQSAPADETPPQPAVVENEAATQTASAEQEAEAAAEEKPGRQNADPLDAELQKLMTIQNEIRVLLDIAESVGEQHDQPKDEPKQASETKEDEPAATLDSQAAANAFYLSGRYAEAFAFYNRAEAETEKPDPWLLFQKANCLRWLGRATEANAVYQKIVTSHPDSMWADHAAWWIEAVEWRLKQYDEQ